MPPKGHALLSASSSDRWLHCPPSARLCETYEDKGSDYAAEGTDAHTLCEYKLRKALGMETTDPTENLTWFNQEMDDCATGYAAYILELVEAAKENCPDPVVLIEQRVDFSRWVEEGFGTSDAILIADGTMHVIDYKHGLGVLVSAEDNPQMKCYALGALELFDGIYDIDTVSMTIYQPRRQNISTFEVSKDDLYRWADEVLKPTAELAFAGDGNFLCGEWCGFCKAKNECRARADANLELARYDFKLPPLLTDEDIEDMLGSVKDSIINAYEIKTGLSRAKLSHLMDAETWMDANKAVELGFADEIMQRGTESEDAPVPTVSMLYSKANVVNSLMEKIAAKCAITPKPTRTQKADELMDRLNLIKNWR